MHALTDLLLLLLNHCRCLDRAFAQELETFTTLFLRVSIDS